MITVCGIRREDRIGFQQTRNMIACLQFDHTQQYESTTDRFALLMYGEFNWKYGQIGLLCTPWLGFTREKIAWIFRVSRWTVVRRVRLCDLEHSVLFSFMTDEETDSAIPDFITRHGSTTGETRTLREMGTLYKGDRSDGA